MRLILLLIAVAATLPVSWSQQAENVLLDQIVVSCAKKASLSCVGDQALRYLHDTFNSSENWKVTENFKFDRNQAPDVTFRQQRDFKDFSDVVYERGVQYLMTHDLTWSLPQTFFGGAVVKVSKPDTPSGRTIFHVELLEPEVQEDSKENTEVEARSADEGRLFFKNLFGKKIKKKLLLGFFALLLIIKLIKIKLFFLLPLILGVGTVKKLAIKFLFFIFPALAALFKSCHHHHHHVPVKQYHLHTVKHQGPPAHYDDYHHSGPPDWLRRNEYVQQDTTASSWEAYDSRPINNYPDVSAQEAYSKKLKQQAAELSQKYQYRDVIPSTELPYKVAQLSYLPSDSSRPSAAAIPVSTDNYDAFYSPKLVRIDRVFLQMGFNDEGCRERLVCSMYKNPTRFSPNSNLVSAELSIDPQELRTPNKATVSVRRFFKYVQAAKDGQELQDCIRLYPSCNTNTDS